MTNETRQRAIRYWRLVTLLYAAALTAGTHWPQLSVGVGSGPPPDKVLHLFAFGGLTLLLWQCRFVSRVWHVGVIAAVWVLLDEWTQSLPMLNRQSSWTDVAAGLAGVVCAVLWLWATAPTGAIPARWRRKMFDQTVETKLSTIRGWVVLGCGSGVIGSAAAALAIVFAVCIGNLFRSYADLQFTVLIALGLGSIFGVFVVFDRWWKTKSKNPSHRCFRCGADCPDELFAADGWGMCRNCNVRVHECQWIVASDAPKSNLISLLAAGFIIACMSALPFTGVVMWVLIQLFAIGHGNSPADRLITVAVLFVVLCSAAVAAMVVRSGLAGRFSFYGIYCTKCGYDLRYNKVDPAHVRCPECGEEFARVNPLPVERDNA